MQLTIDLAGEYQYFAMFRFARSHRAFFPDLAGHSRQPEVTRGTQWC